MIIYLKKYIDDDCDIEYIRAEDVLEYGNEEDQQLQHLYMFASMLEKELNYFNMNSSTAFGNPDFSFYQGQVRGWLAAMQWECEERTTDNGILLVYKTQKGRTVMKVEKPKIPEAEKRHRKQLAKDMEAFGL